MIIGVLVTALAFTIIGARGKNTITAKAIRIVNQKGKVAAILASNSVGNGLEIRNGKGKIMADLINGTLLTALTLYSGEKPACQLVSAFLGELGLYGGLYMYNQHGKEVVKLQSTSGGGWLSIYNQHGKEVATLGSHEARGGGLYLYNQHGKHIVILGSDTYGDGAIFLGDRYGDLGWAKIGKR